MAKTFFTFFFIYFLHICPLNIDQNVSVISNDIVKTITIKDIYTSQLGVRELTGNNDGPQVKMYLKSVGLGEGFSWCAAFVHWCLDSAKIKNTITGWSPTAHNSNNIVWFKRKLNKELEEGDVFTLYSATLKRIHHTGFFDSKLNNTIYQTVEGNTNDNGSVNGNGVYKRKRSFNATYSITRWKKD